MNKRFILYCVLCALTASVCGQTTYYFKLTNIHDNKSSLKIQGGQYITFLGDICFESDKKGIGVGHGTMAFNPNYSTSSVKKYMGGSYWGNDAVYAFNSDKSVLNVVLENDMILIYKRATPPVDVNTCSLIRPQKSNSSGVQDIYFDPYHPISLHPSPIPDPAPNPNPIIDSYLTATQYQQLYNGYEKVAIGVFNSFNANPNMNAGPRSQNMQILQGAQRDMLRIRQEAASHGITIPQSHYETATP